MFKLYELDLLRRSLSILIANYDEYDLDELSYSNKELESEISQLINKVDHLSVTLHRDKVIKIHVKLDTEGVLLNVLRDTSNDIGFCRRDEIIESKRKPYAEFDVDIRELLK